MMNVWVEIKKDVLILHLFGRHIALGGGFRDNYGDWHDDVGEPIYCKCGVEV